MSYEVEKYEIGTNSVKDMSFWRLFEDGYNEMHAREVELELPNKPFNPNIDFFENAGNFYFIKNYFLLFNGIPVGLSINFLDEDIFISEIVANECMIYVEKEHRNGIGSKFAYFIDNDLLQNCGATWINRFVSGKRIKLAERHGYKSISHIMRLVRS